MKNHKRQTKRIRIRSEEALNILKLLDHRIFLDSLKIFYNLRVTKRLMWDEIHNCKIHMKNIQPTHVTFVSVMMVVISHGF